MAKGGVRPNSGRKPGSKNQKTMEWENLGDFLTKAGAERAKRILNNSKDEKFMDYYLSIINYFKPRQQANQNTHIFDSETEVHIGKKKLDA